MSWGNIFHKYFYSLRSAKGAAWWQETNEWLSPIFSGYLPMHLFANSEPCISFK